MSLSPPLDIDLKIVAGRFVLSWEEITDTKYNVYARFESKPDWKKMNEQPLQDNFISFKKPEVKGVYKFSITSVANNRESNFSEVVSIKID